MSEIENIIIPKIREKKKEKICERKNYIPHKEISRDREIWHNYYMNNIYDIYLIIKGATEKEFPKRAKWENNHIFHNLSRTLFHCSTKYIYELDNNI